MEIVLDCREHKLIAETKKLLEKDIKFKGVSVTTENLEIGDILIRDPNGLKLIIERKSISDLVSSIKDGRYTEQSYRLTGFEHPNHNIVYLVEGDIGFENKQMVYSSIFSLNSFRKNSS